MQDNWAPPTTPSTAAPARSLGWLTPAVTVQQGVVAAGMVGITALELAGTALYGDFLTAQDPGALVIVAAYGLVGLVVFATALFGTPVWVLWHHRAGSVLHGVGRGGLEFTPGWHAAWWFVPFANLVMPFRAMRELVMASDPDKDDVDWKLASVPSLLGVWWAAYLIGNVVNNVSAWSPEVQAGAVAGLIGTPLAVLATGLYLRFVWLVHGRQRRLAVPE